MDKYHKINTVYKRTEKGELLLGQYADPVFEYLASTQWVFTEKVDGTNIRIQWDGSTVYFCGKTDRAQMPPFLLAKLESLFDSDAMYKQFGSDPACLYGEGFGARIQKGGGKYISDGVSFVLFDVRIGDLWLCRKDVEDVSVGLDIAVVPIVASGTLEDMELYVRASLKSQWGDFCAEGLVARPAVELRTRRGDRVITKLKTRDFPGIRA